MRNVIKSGQIHKSYNPQIKDRRINYLFILLPFLWMRRVGKQMKLAEHMPATIIAEPVGYYTATVLIKKKFAKIFFNCQKTRKQTASFFSKFFIRLKGLFNFAGAGPFYPALAPQHYPLLGVGIKIPI